MTALEMVNHDLLKDYHPERRPFLLALKERLIQERDETFRITMAVSKRAAERFKPSRLVPSHPTGEESFRCRICSKLTGGGLCAAHKFDEEI